MCTHPYTYNIHTNNVRFQVLLYHLSLSLSFRLTQYFLPVLSFCFGRNVSKHLDGRMQTLTLIAHLRFLSTLLSTSFDLTCIELERWKVEEEKERRGRERRGRWGRKNNLCYWCFWWECSFYGVILLSTSNWHFNDSSQWPQSFTLSYFHFFLSFLLSHMKTRKRNEMVARKKWFDGKWLEQNSRSGIGTCKRGEERTFYKQVKVRRKNLGKFDQTQTGCFLSSNKPVFTFNTNEWKRKKDKNPSWSRKVLPAWWWLHLTHSLPFSLWRFSPQIFSHSIPSPLEPFSESRMLRKNSSWIIQVLGGGVSLSLSLRVHSLHLLLLTLFSGLFLSPSPSLHTVRIASIQKPTHIIITINLSGKNTLRKGYDHQEREKGRKEQGTRRRQVE